MKILSGNLFGEGKKSKIAYKILQNPKSEGGLNLVNLVVKEKSLKATWPMILAKEKDYSQLVYGIMRCTSINEMIWCCNLKCEDVKLLHISCQFWEDVLCAWCEYNYYSDQRIENQILWYNSNIRIRNRPFFWKDAFQKGLVYVHQLFENGNFKSQMGIFEEFGISIMRYNSLKSALSSEWIDFFSTHHKLSYIPLPPHMYERFIILNGIGLTSKVYKFLSDDVMIVHHKYIKWKEELGYSFDESLWEFRYLHLEHIQSYKCRKVQKFSVQANTKNFDHQCSII